MAQDLVIKVVGDTRSIESAFKRTSKQTNALEKDLLRVGKRAAIAVGALGVAAGAASFKLVKMAGDAEEVRSKFQVTFQQEMPRMVRQLDAFSKATGASRFELRQQTADLGALLVPLVGSRKAAGDLSVGFTKLATDLSSFNNVPVADALTAIRAGLVGEAEPLRRFGVLLNEAAVKAEAYRSGIAKSGAALTEQQKVQARANLIMQQTKLAQGDATRTADSFTNQMRKLQNQVRDTATELGLKLLPVATAVLTKLNEWGPAIAREVQPYLDRLSDWVDRNRQEFKDFFLDARDAGATFADVLERIAVAADKVATAMGGWSEAFKLVIGGVIAAKLAGILGVLAGPGGKGGGILGAMTKLKALGPISLVVALSIAKKSGMKELAEEIAAKKHTSFGAGALDTLIGGGSSTGAGLQLPTAFKSTHQTSGLAGFPATDIFGKAGTPVLAPENGRIVSIRPFNSDPDFYGMAIYYLGASGATYYIKHIYDPAPIGRYKRGDVIGKIAQGTTGGPHVHFGKRTGPGIPIPISSAATSGGGGGTVGGGGTQTGGAAPTTKVEELIPARQRLALARAEGTKNIGDDLTALRAMVAYLQKLLPKTKDIEKRIEITEALNGLKDRIRDLGKTGKADIADVIDYDKLKAKLREQFRQGIENARKTITDARASFGAAFGILTDSLLNVFDAKTEKMLADLRVKVAGFDFTIGAGEETPTEKLLRDRRERKIDDDLAAARAKASTVDEIREADAALEERRLEKQAAAERAAADQSLEDARKKLTEERALQRDAFNKELADLQEKWNRTNATTAQRTKELNQLMAKFGTPFEEVGSLLGTSFANGFLDSINIVFDRLAELAKALNQITPAQAAEAVILAGGSALAARSAALNAKYGLGSLQQFQTGGVVKGLGPQLAIVHGGETVIPRGATTTGPEVIQVVLDGRVIAEAVRRQNQVYAAQNLGFRSL